MGFYAPAPSGGLGGDATGRGGRTRLPWYPRHRSGGAHAAAAGQGCAPRHGSAGFLRAIGEARLITPLRSGGGHRRCSRHRLRIAARARELVDQGTPIEAACRIVILEDQLGEAQRINAEYRRTGGSPGPSTAA
ncbi:MerR family transcriptional regulator [Streptomyces griseomycini]|nr:MerR family transcriptional regulator [Streptomyces griseomycini]